MTKPILQISDSESEDDLLESVLRFPNVQPDQSLLCTITNSDSSTNCTTPSSTLPINPDIPPSQLIGTSSERKDIISEQNNEYIQSLEADRLKQVTKRRQENLREARTQRVLPIPAIDEPQVKISIRHTSLGVVSRAFPIDSYISSVYDWIGSLCLMPEHFVLKMRNAHEVSPLQPVLAFDKMVLNMCETPNSSPPYPDQDVSFLGFGQETPSNLLADDTFEENDVLR